MRRGKGFTLIELLVVVAIIGALIAIMVPSLSKARQRAKTLQCGTNARSISQAFNIYVQEIGGQNNLTDFFPARHVIPNKMLVCPQTQVVTYAKETGSHFGSTFQTWAGSFDFGDNVYSSYGANYFWARPPLKIGKGFIYDPGVYNRMKPLSESTIPAFADAANVEICADEANSIPIKQSYTPTSQLGATAMRRHGSTTNVAFADAHLEAVKLEDLWTLRWKSNWKCTAPYPVPASWNGFDPAP